ncbi:MAG: ATP-binding protein [Lachnospiraceae bacterium]|jgi:DNA replication protein DnaC|nr:ATP-binding protein [Lachnospiraceae bacterium]HBV81336.1 DNA replication protein DnaC [Lachnospiraceae bacterium]
MALTNSQYDAIMRSYEEKQRIARHQLEHNTEMVYQKIPTYEALDRQIAIISIEQGKKLLSGEANALSELKQHLKELSVQKASLLRKNGFPENFLSPVYECDKCQDTGYIANKKCSCFREAEINLIYEQSHIKTLLETENFSSLSYDYYAGEDLEKFTKAVQICQNFVKSFNKDYRNLFFYGTVGTGKSFLSCCIAKELIDIGNLVIYFSASQLFDILSKSTFDKDSAEAASGISEDICNCDLLIIDDLGTELTNAFVSSQLFSCLNNRHLRKKATIITTNLSLGELRDRYSDRIFSRITSNYDICKLTGRDIRMQKKTASANK